MAPTTVHAAFAARAERTPDAIAVVCDDAKLTYRELDRAVARLAARLRASGVAPGALVGIYLEREPALIIAMLAILRTGAAYLPLDVLEPEARRGQIVRDAGPVVIVTRTGLRDRVAALAGTLCVDAPDGDAAPDFADEVSTQTRPGDLAYVMYTSGSTGTPKGVCVPHAAIVTLVVGADYVTLGADAVVLMLAPASFDAATFEVWGALLTGGRVVLVSTPHPSLDQLAAIIARERVTTMFLTTALFRQVVDEHPDALAGVRELLTGGEMVSAPHFRTILARFPALAVVHVYGPTECTTFASAYACTRSTPIGDTVPIGRGIAGRTVHVLRDGVEPVDTGDEGEICIGGAGVALGYLGRSDATQTAFVPDPFRGDADARMYRTGDRGRLLAGGVVEFVGRTDRQVKIRGHRVELGEVEAALRLHPAVRDVIASTEPSSNGTKDLVVHVLADPQAAGAKPDGVEAWRRTYEDVIYQREAPGDGDPALNTVGWNSSYTGMPIARDEMLEQVEAAVGRIRQRRPRRVLEIGCGTGMLLFRLAPDCETYVGTDFSRTALAFVEAHLARLVPPGRVRLIDGRADELPTDARFDAVILNSVVQHFPDVDYLREVLRRAIALVDDGGFVFVGDVQNLRLLRLFHLDVELGRVSAALPVPDLLALVDRRERDERHLVIDPAFFEAAALERVSDVRIQLKRGRYHNELTRFRYDAILEIGATRAAELAPDTIELPADGPVDAWLPALMRERGGRAARIARVANARTATAVRAIARIESASPPRTVGELRASLAADVPDAAPRAAVDPEELWSVAEAHGHEATIAWHPDDAGGAYDVTLTPAGHAPPASARERAAPGAWRQLANQPHRPFSDAFVAGLKTHLRERVPSYMVPAHVVCLERWPLTPNGKVDTAKLPRRQQRERTPAASHAALPPHVRALAEMWSDVLGVDSVAPDDNFFDLGGDSLKAIELAHRASRKFGVTLSPVSLFERPTLGALAGLLDGSPGAFDSDLASSAEAARARGAARRNRSGR